MITPIDGWVKINDEAELLEFLKRIKLTPKSSTEPKPLIYEGIYVDAPAECRVIGYVDDILIVIEVNGQLHTIHTEHLRDMQVGSASKLLDISSDHKLLDYVCFDIETTGLNQKTDEIIEISAIRVSNGQIVETFDQLVQPENPIPFDSSIFTGITNEMVANAPPISAVITEFLEFIGDSVLVGHNIASFDLPFCSRVALQCCSIHLPTIRYVDTLALARTLLTLESYKLEWIADALGIEQQGAHRAMADCQTTWQCFEKLQRMDANAAAVETFVPNHVDRKNDNARASAFKPAISPSDLARFRNRPRAKDIVSTIQHHDKSHPLYNQTCVVTGSFVQMSDADAMQAIADHGGHCADSVTKKTDVLIIGGASDPQKKSGKLKKAEDYIACGQDIRILSEDEFTMLLNQPVVLPHAESAETEKSALAKVSTEELAQLLDACIRAPLDAAPEAYDLSQVKTEFRTPEKSQSYWCISILRQPCFNFKGSRPKRVDIAPIISRLMELAGLPVEMRLNAAGQQRDEWPRCTETDLLNWLHDKNNHDVFTQIYEKLLRAAGFDCCSKYNECSDAGYCIHTDIMFAGQCTYRPKLQKGIIFFGQKRTI